jgi:hypothetical protein
VRYDWYCGSRDRVGEQAAAKRRPGLGKCGKRRDSGSLVRRRSTARNLHVLRSVNRPAGSFACPCVRAAVRRWAESKTQDGVNSPRADPRPGPDKSEHSQRLLTPSHPIPSVARPSVPAAAEPFAWSEEISRQ